ncbi:FRG domain-containing protein [Roseisolibacter sp. H3M3-2]|uniref:FRG domain-containing protein n=1 Tax=Roseisolibacter sp. H3M3-2 TaxID=3031323 RepID=UPI0023DA9BBF|nr:FRG domain-containing protein [Roseisolibacter sp. H3M3-2]MDF1502894.1 FRG domain-containing protein [Roseisolibacter sp. H3M3-2]
MPIQTIEVGSLGELIDRLTPAEPDPRTGRRRDTGVYRGAGNASWPLYTSLDRLGGIAPAHGKRALEEHILRNFVRYSRPHFPHARNDWELLVAAQHHGLPTRLLDWSYSPLVAAHFATMGVRAGTDGGGTDRAIWRLDWQRVHRHFGFPEIALLTDDLDRLRDTDGDGHFPPYELMRARELAPFACLIEPPTLDARIAAQAAAFTLCSAADRPFDAFLAEHGVEGALTKLVIPAAHVSRVRDQLDLASVDERRLFPDLDGVAARMRRYYE